MDFTKQYYQVIQDEISKDPMNRGYAGKTSQEVSDLLNSPYTIMIPQEQTARIAIIINQIPFTKNKAALNDITEAGKLPPTPINAGTEDIKP